MALMCEKDSNELSAADLHRGVWFGYVSADADASSSSSEVSSPPYTRIEDRSIADAEFMSLTRTKNLVKGRCTHDRVKQRCKECGGSGKTPLGNFCKHGRRKDRCKECGGSQICEHGRRKDQCKECGASGKIPQIPLGNLGNFLQAW